MKKPPLQTLLFLLLTICPLASLQACPEVVEEVRPAPPAAEHELALASFNLWDFMADGRDGDHVSEAVLAERMPVTARWIVDVLGAPQVLAVQEAGSRDVLVRLAEAVTDIGGPAYQVVLLPGVDRSGIHTAVLIGEGIDIGRADLLFADQSRGRHWLFDRPPLHLRVSAPLDFDLVVVHLRSGRGLDRPSQRDWITRKRRAQAEKLRGWMTAQRLAGHRPVIAGDLNSAPDAGVFSEPYEILSQAPWQSVWHWIDGEERFSHIFRCRRQAIDHILLPPSLQARVTRAAVTRGNAGRYRPLYDKRGTGEVVSDHDALVVYFDKRQTSDVRR